MCLSKSKYYSTPFYQDELVIVVHKEHPLLKTNNLKELEKYDYYSREKGSSVYKLVENYLMNHHLNIHTTIECSNPNALIELVRYNDGFTILPYSLVKHSKDIAIINNQEFHIQRTYQIVIHRNKKQSSLYQEIFNIIKKTMP